MKDVKKTTAAAVLEILLLIRGIVRLIAKVGVVFAALCFFAVKGGTLGEFFLALGLLFFNLGVLIFYDILLQKLAAASDQQLFLSK